ncbi:sensor histidine kinase [Actinoplanes couchii]|uniref:histidine kinase n=1 Tax=Actinoplanes couchii TaxID=403638 RepID=A0ABQ3XB62_9ACTN|nr:nitrate- and nitrite sensing domain-containing protein [Actinoplanes couchii]MDR6323248.1 hypothetical protein [Actinoplanes couchii]GID55762.1 histidine kinase [Actinoplanes couchii]
MRRTRSIRSKIIALVSVPVAAMVALWIFATIVTVGPAYRLLSTQSLVESLSAPGWNLLLQTQKERRLSIEFLADRDSGTTALAAQRVSTDQAVALWQANVAKDEIQRQASDTFRPLLNDVVTATEGLAGIRARIDARQVDPAEAREYFTAIPDGVIHAFNQAAAFGDEATDNEIRALVLVGRGHEQLSRADAVLVEAFATGELSVTNRVAVFEALSASRVLLRQAATELSAPSTTEFTTTRNGTAMQNLEAAEDTLLRSARAGQPVPITEASWRSTFEAGADALFAFQAAPAGRLGEMARPKAVTLLSQLAGAGVVGLLAVIVSIVVSVRIGRSIVDRLARLRDEALEMATNRLPKVVHRLRHSESVDVAVEAPQLALGTDEVGQVGEAFNEVRRTAIQSAIEEATVRRGLNEVFLNIARRSQMLLHRQLSLLDKMERRQAEPQELEDLYRVDHLATRMRRHAEDLVILAGAAPGRGWRNPITVIDVVRGSISEVEDYQRIDVASVENAQIVGRAVADVVHLLAELFENAASYSPPTTRVAVTGQVLPNGYAIEIEDRGLGMSPEAVDAANRKLIEPPEFDPAESARLGLFVVAKLAHRQGIRVSLRPSVYGGITAIVLLPADLMADGTESGPVTSALAPERLDMPPREIPADSRPAPTRSTVMDDLNADGLTQRRRGAPPSNGPLEAPVHLPPNLDSPVAFRAPGPEGLPPNIYLDGVLRPVELGNLHPPRRTAENTPQPLSDETLLPRRVRQNNLSPHLREPARNPAEPPKPRSAETTRSIMSSLQQGSNQGRRDAVTPPHGPHNGSHNGTQQYR